MKIYNRLLIIVGLLSIYSCEKELLITEFSDDFSNYKSELKIEAIIFPTEKTAIVRIDKSVLITDISQYDCIDDDYGRTTEQECENLEGFWHGDADSTIASCGDWNPDIHDIGIDGVKGDPSDDDGDCDDCSYGDRLCQENCRDEDSIGENNGVPDCNEPNVDNYSEFLPDIHVQGDGCTVRITKIDTLDLSEEICEFTFNSTAGAFFDVRYTGSDERSSSPLVDDIYQEYYGAYIPNEDCSPTMWANEDGSLDTGSEYSFYADCSKAGFGIVISKEPIRVSDPVVFVDIIVNSPDENPDAQNKILEYVETLGINNCTDYICLDENKLDNEFVYFPRYSQPLSSYILWATISPNVYFQATQYMYDSTMTHKIYHGHPAVGTEFLNIVDDVCLMNEVIVTDFYDGYGNGEWDNSTDDKKNSGEIFVDEDGDGEYDEGEFFIDAADGVGDIDTYFYEISTFSESYRNYYYFAQLLPDDPVRSNLRDENMNPVIGAFGSISNNKINIKIIDCLDFTTDENDNFEWTYKTKEDCEDPSVTHNVCKWYENKTIDFYTGDLCAPINFWK